MLDADDAILEQAMQTGAALKRARDLQKAARKPKVRPRPVTSSHMHVCDTIAAMLAAPNTCLSEAALPLTPGFCFIRHANRTANDHHKSYALGTWRSYG